MATAKWVATATSTALLWAPMGVAAASQPDRVPVEQPATAPDSDTADAPASEGGTSRSLSPELPDDLLSANGIVPPTPDQGAQLTERQRTALSRQAWLSQGPALTPAVHSVLPARAGGTGVVRISTARRSSPGVNVRKVSVRIAKPRGVRALRAKGKGWRCRPGKKITTCRNPRTFGPRSVPASIKVVLSVKKGFRGKTGPVRARVGWSEQKIVVGAGGSTGPIGTFRADGWQRQTLQESTRVPVDPRLRLSLTAAAVKSKAVAGREIPIVTHAGRRAREFVLTASVRRTLGRKTAVRWSKVRGPKVSFRGPRFQKGVEQAASQVVLVGNRLRKPTRFTFRVRASSGGSTVSKRITVLVRPKRLGRFRSDERDLRRLAKRQKRSLTKGQKGARVKRARVHTVRVSERGPRRVTPGERSTIALKTKRKIRSIEWSVLEGSVDPASFTTSGAKLTFTAPDRAGETALIQAVATMGNGDLVHRAKLIVVRPAAVGGGRQVGAEPPADADVQAFCTVATAANTGPARISLADGSVISLPRTALSGAKTCNQSGARLAFTQATFTYAGSTFRNLAGTVTATGIVIDSAAYVLPPALQKWASKAYSEAPTALPVQPVGGNVSAGLQDGTWQAMTGQFAVLPFATAQGSQQAMQNALAFLPLPGGWSFPANSSRLSLNPQSADGGQASLIFQQVAQGPSGTAGSVSFDLKLSNGTVSTVDVTAANIGVFGTTGTDQVSASGNGSFTIGPDGSVNVDQLSFGISCGAADGCVLVQGLLFQSGTLSWSTQGMGIAFQGVVRAKGEDYGLSGNGTYTSAMQWSVGLASTSDWKLGDTGVTLSGLKGQLAWVPVNPSAQQPSPRLSRRSFGSPPAVPPSSRVNFTVAGAATIDQASNAAVALSNVSAQVTNECNAASVQAKTCDRGQVRVDLTADAKVTLPGNTPRTLGLTATINLSTLDFTFSGNLTGVSFGPAAFKIQSVALTLSNTGQGACVPKGQKPPESGLVVGLNASGRMLNQPATMSGMVGPEGYCLWGDLKQVSVGGATISGVTFGYATFNATVTTGTTGPAAKGFAVPANSVSLVAGFTLPKAVQKVLPAGGQGEFTARLAAGAQTFTGSVGFDWKQPVWLFPGGTSNTNLGLQSAGMTVNADLDSGSLAMSMEAAAELFVPANAKKGLAASNTPMFVKIGISVNAAGANLTFSAGVNPNTGKPNSQPITNAFGQPGLTVKALAVSGSLGTSNTLDFYADVELPPAWEKEIAITQPNADIIFGLSINVEDPVQSCLIFEVGSSSSWADVRTGYQNSPMVVDLADKGIVQARFFKLAIAPTGCTLPSGQNSTYTVPAGYAFAFDGEVLGATVLVQVEVELPTAANGGALRVSGALEMQDVKLAGAELTGSKAINKPGCVNASGPRLNVNIDTGKGVYAFDVSGRIQVGKVPIAGAYIDICGSVAAQNTSVSATLYGQGEMKLIGLGTQADVTVSFAMSGGTVKSSNVAMAFTTDILVIKFRGSANLVYANGEMREFRAAVGDSFKFLVGKFSGNVAVGYCAGRWSSSVSSPSCSAGSGVNMRVDLWGKIKFLFWSKKFDKSIYNHYSAGSSSVSLSESSSTLQTQLSQNALAPGLTLDELTSSYDSQGTYSGGATPVPYLLKVNKPTGRQPCQSVGVAVDWTQESTSPAAMTVLPPSPSGCTISAYVSWAGSGQSDWQPPVPVTLACDDSGCWRLGAPAGRFVDDLSKPEFGELPASTYTDGVIPGPQMAMTKILAAFGRTSDT